MTVYYNTLDKGRICDIW